MDHNLKSNKPFSAFLFGYGVALGATGVAALVRWFLPGALAPTPYLGFYPAVVVSAALGGLGPGLVATFASLLLVNFIFGSFNINDHGVMMRQVIWVVASIGVCLLAEMQRKAQIQADDEADSARAAEQALRRQVELVDPARAEIIAREMQCAVRERRDERAMPAKPADDQLRRVADAAGALVAGVGVLVLAGWIFDLDPLKSLIPGLASMKANTAICFIFSGLALALREQRALRLTLAGLVIAVAGLTMAEYVGDADLVIDQLLFRDAVDIHTIHPGRMVEATTLGLLSAAASLLLLRAGSSAWRRTQQVLALSAGVIGLIGVLGYACNAGEFYRFAGHGSIALNTAFSFVVLAIGLVFARPDGYARVFASPGPAAQMMRRLLPVVLLAPAITGWLVGRGAELGIYGLGMDLALLALMMTLSLTTLVWWTAAAVNRADAARRETEAQLRNQADVLNQSHDALIIREKGGVVRYWNRGAEELYGWPAAEALGRSKQLLFHTEGHSLEELDRQLEVSGRWEGELAHNTADGRCIVVDSRQTATRGADGRLLVLESNHDITKRKRAEEALRHAAAEWEQTFNSVPDLIAVLDPEHRILRANRAMAERLGVTTEQCRGAICYRIVHGTNAPPDFCPQVQAIAQRRECVAEVHEPRLGGDFIVSCTPLFDTCGELTSTVHVSRDITERKRAEEALRKAHEEMGLRVEERTRELRYANAYNRSLIEASLDPLATIGYDGRIKDVNVAAEAATGCSRNDLIGTDFCDYFSDPDKARAGYQQVFREGSVRDYPLELRHCDGHLTSVLYNASVYRDEAGEVSGVFAAARDITERKRAEARTIRNNAILKAINQVFQETLFCESEERLCKKCLAIAEALTGSRFGIIAELNPSGRLDTIALSDPGWSACRMAKTDAVLSLKDLPIRGLLGSIIRQGKSAIINDPETAPERAGTPEGHPPITSLLGVPLQQAGKTLGLIALANKEGGYDESDREAVEVLAMAVVEALMRLRAEIGIRIMNAELEQRVLERTAELEAFAYSVSHDLRAPLRSINGFSRVLEEDYGDRLDAEGKESLRRIVASTTTMGQLIDDLLNLSRITRAEMRRGRVDLSEHARMIAGRLKEARPERPVEFIIAEDMVADGDDHLLEVVLENLLGNAWKFTENTPLARIEFGEAQIEGNAAYFVRDNGTGFDMAYAGKLFSPFERLHSVEQFPGTGIGLATVKRIVDRHGGRVWAEGAVNKGATIYFTLSENRKEEINEDEDNPAGGRQSG